MTNKLKHFDALTILHDMYRMHQELIGYQRFDLLPKWHIAAGHIEQMWQNATDKTNKTGIETIHDWGELPEKLRDTLREIAVEMQQTIKDKEYANH